MAKSGPKKVHSKNESSAETGESTAAYFRRIFAEHPTLLESGSNKETLEWWLKDHPGVKEVPNKVKSSLANSKSVLRKKGRTRGKREQIERAAQPNAAAPLRRGGLVLEALEEQIDDALTLAKNIDRESLDAVIQYLRQARNLVVWKMGK